QFFELAAAQVAKQDTGRFIRSVWQLPLYLRRDHAGCEEDIGKTIVVEILQCGAPSDEARLHPQPCPSGHIPEGTLAAVLVQDIRVGAEMCFENIEVAIGVEIPTPQPHPRLFFPVLIQRDTALQTPLAER